jgi:hypothetical protein
VARDSTSIEIAALLQAAIESASLRIPLCGLVQLLLTQPFRLIRFEAILRAG